MNKEDLLQEKLELLEAGEPIENCLQDLPEAEAEAVQLAAALREVATARQDAPTIAAQRAAVLNAANQYGSVPLVKVQAPLAAGTAKLSQALSTVRSRMDWLLSSQELTVFAGVTLALLIVLFAWSAFKGDAREDNLTAGTEGEQEVAAAPPAADAAASADEASDSAPAVVEPAEDPEFSAFIPIVSDPLVLDAQTAAVQNVKGTVEVQEADGTWTVVNQTAAVKAGQRLRTGDLSSATIAFFDGSQAELGPNSEISVDELNANLPGNGPRVVVMTQQVGESDHAVQSRGDEGSRYVVNTPAGTGEARGTKFKVLVTPSLEARFVVIEGKVDVKGLDKTVSLLAGQLTTIIAGRVPEEPAFYVSGEGRVTEIGSTWTIAGQTFQTDGSTLIVGNPQIGDLVYVDGHFLPDGTRMADRIILLQREISNQFSLAGEVDSMDGNAWTIAGQTVLVNGDTAIDEDIEVGDTVRVTGIIASGGSLQATHIARIEDAPGQPFHFVGTVELKGGNAWSISGNVVSTDEETAIDEGIEVGDLVAVQGWILDDGTWLATSIASSDEDAAEDRAFAFTGQVMSTGPWNVAGIAFETRDWTVIESGIEVGDLVAVRGVVLDDGTWVASFIEDIDDHDEHTIVLVGTVGSIDPWIINGITLVVDGASGIPADIIVGMLVWVEIELLPDGTWHVIAIDAVHPTFGLGCFMVSSVVVSVNAAQLQLKYWPTIQLSDKVKIDGELKVDGIVTLPVCYWFDGTFIVHHIVVVYEPIIIIQPAPRGNHNGKHKHKGNKNG